MSLSAKEAVSKAFEVAKEYEDFLAPEKGFKNLRLEAVEFTPTPHEWHITVGFDTGKMKATQTSGIGSVIPQTTREEEREFKTIVLDNDGNFKKIEIR